MTDSPSTGAGAGRRRRPGQRRHVAPDAAEAAGLAAVVVCAGAVDPTEPKCVRASAGAVFHAAGGRRRGGRCPRRARHAPATGASPRSRTPPSPTTTRTSTGRVALVSAARPTGFPPISRPRRRAGRHPHGRTERVAQRGDGRFGAVLRGAAPAACRGARRAGDRLDAGPGPGGNARRHHDRRDRPPSPPRPTRPERAAGRLARSAAIVVDRRDPRKTLDADRLQAPPGRARPGRTPHVGRRPEPCPGAASRTALCSRGAPS